MGIEEQTRLDNTSASSATPSEAPILSSMNHRTHQSFGIHVSYASSWDPLLATTLRIQAKLSLGVRLPLPWP